MDKVFFKIIIPNYNSIAYIKQCLDSIASQTFTDYAVVIVDDMSTDLSDKVCDTYARKFPGKFIVERAPQKWLAGKCRNYGVSYPIESEYILFVDADDMLNGKHALKKVYDNLKSRPDVLLFNYSILKNGHCMPLTASKFNVKSDTLANTMYNSSWSKAIKSSKVEKFLEGIMRGEDTYMWLQVLDKHPTIAQMEESVYVYRMYGSNTVFSEQFKKDGKALLAALAQLRKRMTDKHVIASIDRRIGK